MTQPFRFGLQVSVDSATDVVGEAKAAEAAGFDIVTMADHIGARLQPTIALAAIAEATSEIRLGTFVINAEFRNPVQLAWETVTLDRLSHGRYEVGLGAGHTPAEFAAIGLPKETGRRRKERLAETVEIIQRLHKGEAVSWKSEFFDLVDAAIDPALQDQLPVLVGGNGDALLRHAGAHADIIGLQGLGRTLEDGHQHTVNFTADHLDAQVASVAAGADAVGRPMPELNALVQVVTVSDDNSELEETKAGMLERVEGLSADDIETAPYVMVGSVDGIVEKLQACRERWGISYFVVRDREAFAPVVAQLSGR